VRGVPFRPGPWMVAGVLAGLIGLVGLAAIYRGMAIGVVSVVSTIAATGPVVPVLVGLALGERPAALQLAGMALLGWRSDRASSFGRPTCRLCLPSEFWTSGRTCSLRLPPPSAS